MLARSGVLLWLLLGPLACAQITSSTSHHVVVKPGAVALTIGSPSGRIVRRGLRAEWTQQLDRLRVEIEETRECETVRHQPVVRIQKTERRAGGALWWEYGLGGLLTGIGIMGVTKPELLSSSYIDENGTLRKDVRSGYRLAGILGSVGVLLLAAGIYDTIRARDTIAYIDAYQIVSGEPIACAEPSLAIGDGRIELVVGDWSASGTTDRHGVVTFSLPAEAELTPHGSTTRVVHRGVIRMPHEHRALAIDFVTPYAITWQAPHAGRASVPPS